MKCQCEHKEHGRGCGNSAVIKTHTTHGTYKVCERCYNERHMLIIDKLKTVAELKVDVAIVEIKKAMTQYDLGLITEETLQKILYAQSYVIYKEGGE